MSSIEYIAENMISVRWDNRWAVPFVDGARPPDVGVVFADGAVGTTKIQFGGQNDICKTPLEALQRVIQAYRAMAGVVESR